jgi:hypothetical protein
VVKAVPLLPLPQIDTTAPGSTSQGE